MALKDVMKGIGGIFSRVTADITRRPDGGTSHYRPLKKKTAEPQQGDMSQNMPNPPFVHTGFTGMNPPSYGGYDQQTGYAQAGYGQPAYGQTAYGQPAYGQPTGSQQSAGYFRTDQNPRQDYVGKGSFSGQTGAQMRRDNVSYMPGVEPPRTDRGQIHVEHIVTLTGLKSCYEAIQCMKDGETLIVMLDAIANESESMRCQDMLAGAAFTLGCSVRLLPGARIVVIAPEGVKILPEQQAAMNPMMQPQPVAAPMAAPMAPAQPLQPARRDRRTSANAADWNAARNGQMDGYNPYTGTMPVAAGAYQSFGGYGF